MSAGFYTALTQLANLKLTEVASMDSIFVLGEPDRAAFLKHMIQSFRFAYVCLWSYLPQPSNCLLFLDGVYQEESSQQPSSSSGSLARRLFNAYCESVIYIDHGQVPGFAFKNNLPYMEMKIDNLQNVTSSEVQMQFYQEAEIKTVVFMGCSKGEIELGMSSELQQNMAHDKPAAFRRYHHSALAPIAARTDQKNNMFKRAVLFFRHLNMRRRQELEIRGNRPTITQLHHMISERRRREKLNESFQVLRSLIPPGSKKDKASVLSSTTEYISLLRSQLAELIKRNEILERTQREGGHEEIRLSSSSTDQRINVEISQVSVASTSEARFLDLRMNLRSGECNMLDLVIGVLEFLKQYQRNISILSLQSNNGMVGTITPVHGLVLRLKVEGDDFDEAAFQEAVRRVLDDLPH